ncbi:TELO2-interacting 1 homolog isoform X3, putative [Babesia ovis]|uniref:TELO2-interacting 1 homolog isoform X3, putative n=1 Tax=Babesia ovis TaxID=5869 RepID=A0A9W5TEG8_BABOV|nr:TELO2-interacting 1 homolog isoform X3, putative [Babesia ovis]
MDITNVIDLQRRLGTLLVLWSRAVEDVNQAQILQDLVGQCRHLLSTLADYPSTSEVTKGVYDNLFRVVKLVSNHLYTFCGYRDQQRYSDEQHLRNPGGNDLDQGGHCYYKQGQTLLKLLKLLVDSCDTSTWDIDALCQGLLSSWRILFATSDSNISSSIEAFKRSSLVIDDLVDITTGLFPRVQREAHVVNLCMILLETLCYTETPKHKSLLLQALVHVPGSINHVYPGVISRIMTQLPRLRESDFARALRVLETWVPSALACDCTGPHCWRRKDTTMATHADKTSEAICLVLSRYGRVRPQHMTGLCISSLRCGCLSQAVFASIQGHVILLLGDNSLWDDARRIVSEAPAFFKTALRSDTTALIRSTEDRQHALNVYLGYAELEKQIPALSALDHYVIMDMLYASAELPSQDHSSFQRLPRLSLCEAPVDFGKFSEPREHVFRRAARDHIGRLAPVEQRQMVSDILDMFIVGLDDTTKALRLLSMLGGLLSSGSIGLSHVVTEVIDVVLFKVIDQDNLPAESHLAVLSLMCVIFSNYQVELPKHQVADLLFWSLPWCLSDSEHTANYAKALLHHLARCHFQADSLEPSARMDLVATTQDTNGYGIPCFLQFYKNLLITRCIRELKRSSLGSTNAAYNIADVLFVLLHYKLPSVKDLFDLVVQFERCWPLLRDLDTSRGTELQLLYSYAFIAYNVDTRFDELATTKGAFTDDTATRPKLPPGDNSIPALSTNGNQTTGTGQANSVSLCVDTCTQDESPLDYKDRRLAVSTIIATRCRYHLSHSNAEVCYVALFALQRCFMSFEHNVPILRVRLYECWDPLIHCMERNMRNLRVMTSIIGIMTIGTKRSYNFVERWLVDVFAKLADLMVVEASQHCVTQADESNRSIRFKFTLTVLEFVLEVSSRVVNRELFSKLLLISLLLCNSTAPSIEQLTVCVLRELYTKNAAITLEALMHTGTNSDQAVFRRLLEPRSPAIQLEGCHNPGRLLQELCSSGITDDLVAKRGTKTLAKTAAHTINEFYRANHFFASQVTSCALDSKKGSLSIKCVEQGIPAANFKFFVSDPVKGIDIDLNGMELVTSSSTRLKRAKYREEPNDRLKRFLFANSPTLFNLDPAFFCSIQRSGLWRNIDYTIWRSSDGQLHLHCYCDGTGITRGIDYTVTNMLSKEGAQLRLGIHDIDLFNTGFQTQLMADIGIRDWYKMSPRHKISASLTYDVLRRTVWSDRSADTVALTLAAQCGVKDFVRLMKRHKDVDGDHSGTTTNGGDAPTISTIVLFNSGHRHGKLTLCADPNHFEFKTDMQAQFKDPRTVPNLVRKIFRLNFPRGISAANSFHVKLPRVKTDPFYLQSRNITSTTVGTYDVDLGFRFGTCSSQSGFRGTIPHTGHYLMLATDVMRSVSPNKFWNVIKPGIFLDLLLRLSGVEDTRLCSFSAGILVKILGIGVSLSLSEIPQNMPSGLRDLFSALRQSFYLTMK